MKNRILNKILTITLSLCLILIPTAGVFAEDAADNGTATKSEQAKEAAAEEQAKKEAEAKAKAEAEAEAARKAAEEAAAAAAAEAEAQAKAEQAAQEEAAKAEAEKKEAEKVEVEVSVPEGETASNEKKAAKAEAQDPIDNSTDFDNGTYKPDDFSFTGGTGKVKITCPKITVKNGKSYADIRFSSTGYNKLVAGDETFEPDAGNTDGILFKNVPVVLNGKTKIIGTTVTMSEPHDIAYEITITLEKPETDEEASTSPVDNSTDLSDGSYKPDTFTYSGGSGRMTIECPSMTVTGGKIMATIVFDTDSIPQVKANGKVYKTTVANGKSTVKIPFANGKDNTVIGLTTKMTEPHWITYTLNGSISADSEPAVEPEEGGEDPSGGDEGDDPDDPDPSDTQKLTNGTWKVKAAVDLIGDGRMLYLYPKNDKKHYAYLTVKDGKMTATITLTGTGYGYLYMGNALEAAGASQASWSAFKKDSNGFYSYTIPVSALDTQLPMAAYGTKGKTWHDHYIIFYSAGATQVEDGASQKTDKKDKNSGKTSGKQSKFKNDKKKDKVSKYKDDKNKSTSAVNNRTTLKDGVYTPDSFRWSGGSGRLAYIRCNKLTVTNGRVYATIEFGSSQYDSLKANGKVYSKKGGGNSKFVIPVKLNANNTIIGRTTAMSQPHWILYRIYIGKAETAKQAAEIKKQEKAAKEKNQKILEEAPEIAGLKSLGESDTEYAKLFKIFRYNHGVTLLSIDIASGTALADDYAKNAKKAAEVQDTIEYDDEGKPIAKSQNEITNELYHNSVVNYLLVPEKYVEKLAAGLDKEYIIVTVPAERSYVGSYAAVDFLDDLDKTDSIASIGLKASKIESEDVQKALEAEDILDAGNYKNPKYAELVKSKTDLTILGGTVLPEKVEKSKKKTLFSKDNTEEQQKIAEEKKTALETSETRFSSLGVPVMIDRSGDEKDVLAKAEWVKVYGALFGAYEDASKLFEEEVKASGQEKEASEK